jgi:hypothetical protein
MCSNTLTRSKFKGLFDFVFVSSRFAQIIGEDFFRDILLPDKRSVVVVETAKFLVPIHQDLKSEFNKKVVELAQTSKLTLLPSKSQA